MIAVCFSSVWRVPFFDRWKASNHTSVVLLIAVIINPSGARTFIRIKILSNENTPQYMYIDLPPIILFPSSSATMRHLGLNSIFTGILLPLLPLHPHLVSLRTTVVFTLLLSLFQIFPLLFLHHHIYLVTTSCLDNLNTDLDYIRLRCDECGLYSILWWLEMDKISRTCAQFNQQIAIIVTRKKAQWWFTLSILFVRSPSLSLFSSSNKLPLVSREKRFNGGSPFLPSLSSHTFNF